jgi:hypothetical protein
MCNALLRIAASFGWKMLRPLEPEGMPNDDPEQ